MSRNGRTSCRLTGRKFRSVTGLYVDAAWRRGHSRSSHDGPPDETLDVQGEGLRVVGVSFLALDQRRDLAAGHEYLAGIDRVRAMPVYPAWCRSCGVQRLEREGARIQAANRCFAELAGAVVPERTDQVDLVAC